MIDNFVQKKGTSSNHSMVVKGEIFLRIKNLMKNHLIQSHNQPFLNFVSLVLFLLSVGLVSMFGATFLFLCALLAAHFVLN